MQAVALFEQEIAQQQLGCAVHYANSSAVRLANIYASHRIYCNRGVNGIEGCLSTAVGMSLDSSANVFCVIGDLAFFYDQNALWNNHIKGNMHILLLNKLGGGRNFQYGCQISVKLQAMKPLLRRITTLMHKVFVNRTMLIIWQFITKRN